MKFFLASLLLPVLVAAQSGLSPDTSSSTTPPSPVIPTVIPTATSATEHVITVGLDDLFMFSSNNITAKENDTVTFFFEGDYQHSVTQSTFANPCTYMSGGFNSGLQPAGNSFSLTVTNASQPIWVYCEQTNPLKHCGIAYYYLFSSINAPTSNNTSSAFMSKAVALGQNGEGSQTQRAALGTGALGAFASQAAAIATSSSGSKFSGERVVIGAGAILAGVAAALYTLA
ncbi:hypothetical protein M422DRAFT_269934 [Sphaerobolus stellatus SS14]|uniref:Blue (type 1) copper domain-containing protein n=1 Tax=Sphaerobolus stellatus (strain SS14) TaxID=990650 RepID=A0A0C9UTT3_SPHS4|nr:hypothetical protein M422DRAFT_269934 [Sphaerobolus stellatus SS14]